MYKYGIKTIAHVLTFSKWVAVTMFVLCVNTHAVWALDVQATRNETGQTMHPQSNVKDGLRGMGGAAFVDPYWVHYEVWKNWLGQGSLHIKATVHASNGSKCQVEGSLQDLKGELPCYKLQIWGDSQLRRESKPIDDVDFENPVAIFKFEHREMWIENEQVATRAGGSRFEQTIGKYLHFEIESRGHAQFPSSEKSHTFLYDAYKNPGTLIVPGQPESQTRERGDQ